MSSVCEPRLPIAVMATATTATSSATTKPKLAYSFWPTDRFLNIFIEDNAPTGRQNDGSAPDPTGVSAGRGPQMRGVAVQQLSDSRHFAAQLHLHCVKVAVFERLSRYCRMCDARPGS